MTDVVVTVTDAAGHSSSSTVTVATTAPLAGTFGPAVYDPATHAVTVPFVNVVPTKLGRDGKDDTGYGPWDTSMDTSGLVLGVAKTAGRIVFSNMNRPGVLFTFTLTAKTGVLTCTLTIPGVVPPKPPDPPVTGTRHLRQGFFKWNNVQQAVDFGNSVGVPVDVWHVSMLSGDTALYAFTGYGGANWLKQDPTRIMVTNWNWLTDIPGQWDNPQTDGEARQFATAIHNMGIETQTVVRPGYEMNAGWMPWGSQYPDNQDGSGFIRLWRRIIPIMRAIAPGLRFDWSTVPSGGSPNPEKFYPGDDVVDFVTMDEYDWWLSGTPQERWDGFLHQPPQGLPWLVGFAATHGKKWGIDETGLVSATNGTMGGGDNPYFITALYDWCEANGAAWVLYEDTDDDIGTYLESNPNGFAAYKAWFQAHRTLVP